jgi:hypothetical protein
MSIKNRFVAMCDILGYKNLIQKNNLEVNVEIFNTLVDETEKSRKNFKMSVTSSPRGFIIDDFEYYKTEYSIFSDTLFFWSNPEETDNYNEIESFFKAIVGIIKSSIKMKIPLRAGIAYGECYIVQEKNIFIGKPIVDAYLTESSQDWIGGTCHKSCKNSSMFNIIKENNSLLIEYNVPLKNDASTVPLNLAINWPAFNLEVINKWLIEERDRCEIPSIWVKYNNSIAFYDYVISQKQIF